jgi:hypothetical protein
MKIILSKILWNFDRELDHAKMQGRDWLQERGRAWVPWDKGPLWVRLKLWA